MKKLPEDDYKLFEQIASLQQPVLMKTLRTYLQKNYKTVVMTRDYLYAVGELPVALVAHCDTVFPTPPTEIYYDKEKGAVWSPTGLGADDRAGVYAILKILRAGYRPTVIFCADEEKGCIGSGIMAAHVPAETFDLKYIIQLDRQGTNDCIFYDCDNEKFVEYVESFGFCEAIGSYSDICELCPTWHVAGVNLSIGYKDEHCRWEVLHVSPMISTITKVKKMLDDISNAPYFEYIPLMSPYGYPYGGRYWQMSWDPTTGTWLGTEGYDDYWEEYTYSKPEEKCWCCGLHFSEYEMFPVQTQNNTEVLMCPDCISDSSNNKVIFWCNKCGSAYMPNDTKTSNRICPRCKKEAIKAACSTKMKSSDKSKKSSSTVKTSVSQTQTPLLKSGSLESGTSLKPSAGNSSLNTLKK